MSCRSWTSAMYSDRPMNSGAISCSPIPTPTTFLSKDRANTASLPPTMIESVPSTAARRVRATGASAKSTPLTLKRRYQLLHQPRRRRRHVDHRLAHPDELEEVTRERVMASTSLPLGLRLLRATWMPARSSRPIPRLPLGLNHGIVAIARACTRL